MAVKHLFDRSVPCAILPPMAQKKNPAAVALGRRGGLAAWRHLSPEQRSQIMKARRRKRK